MRNFETGATRNDDSDKLDYEGFLSPFVLREFGEYMHKHRLQADGKLRASDNWQKGIPQEEYLKSMIRHVMDLWVDSRKGLSDQTTVETLCAVLFNTQGMILEILRAQGKDVGKPSGR
jgi:hypothetical protein